MSTEMIRPGRREKKQFYCPLARIDRKMPTQGDYEHGYPLGAVIHYTASGNSLYDIDHGIKNNYCYWLISTDGTIFQTAPLYRWGYHAGESFHPRLGKSLSSKLLGIEVDCPGKLVRGPQGWRTWYGAPVRDENVIIVDGSGYQRFNSLQLQALEGTLLWLKLNNPLIFDFDNVVGHSEISPRKSDPGGSLGMTLDGFRENLKGMYKAELSYLGVIDGE